jgi:hypothetical protein
MRCLAGGELEIAFEFAPRVIYTNLRFRMINCLKTASRGNAPLPYPVHFILIIKSEETDGGLNGTLMFKQSGGEMLNDAERELFRAD